MVYRVEGQVLEQSRSGVFIRFDGACQQQCRQHCARKSQKIIRLPVRLQKHQSLDKNERVEISMTLSSQIALLANTLLLPLLGFICGAEIGQKMGDWESALCAMLGMSLAVLVCRQFPLDKLKLKKLKEVYKC